jgi:hypothetical protein
MYGPLPLCPLRATHLPRTVPAIHTPWRATMPRARKTPNRLRSAAPAVEQEAPAPLLPAPNNELDNTPTSRPPFNAWWQSVPPNATPEQIAEVKARYDALSVGAGPGVSALPMPEDLDSLSAEELHIRVSGWTPLEFLAHVYRQPFISMSHRIMAARACLEFVHRPQPRALVGVDGEPSVVGGAVVPGIGTIDPRRLTDAQLAELDSLLNAAAVRAPAGVAVPGAPAPQAPPPPAKARKRVK